MLIIHRCRKCGSPDHWHSTGGTAVDTGTVNGRPVAKGRTCCQGSGWSPSQTAPRWRTDGTPIAEVAAPGSRPGGTVTCECDECKAFYTELTGGAA